MSSVFMPPVLFVFQKIFDHSSEEEISEETTEYSEHLQSDWSTFWPIRGEEIVNQSWSHKYSEYLLTKESEDLEITPDPENSVETHLQVETDSHSWQEIWDEHYTEVYNKTYQLYQIVHYQQYFFYRPNIEKIFEELATESYEDTVDFHEQREQLEALGLPTSFGKNNNTHHRRRLHDSSSDSLSVDAEEEEEEEEMPPTQTETPNKKPKKKKNNRKLRNVPKLILEDKSLRNYWQKRFSLFSRFDEGIMLDRESWFSVTPEKVAIHMAERLCCDTIIDAFCGSGGNAIQFALTCTKVIAIDIDAEKIKNAQHNASIYGVANKIDFIIGDYLQLCDSLKGDVVFLSPPWGGPKYMSKKEYNIEESLAPLGATALAEKSRHISENIAFFLPRNSNPKQIMKLAGVGNRVEVEHNYLDTKLVGLTAIYGDWLIDKKNLSDK